MVLNQIGNFFKGIEQGLFEMFNPPAAAPTLDDVYGPQIRADRWKIFDWADQPDNPKITDPPKVVYQRININLPPAPEIPERRLPKEADGQTETKTIGASISVQESLKDRKFGRLLWNPIKDGKQKLRIAYDPSLAKKLKQGSKDSLNDYQNWFKAQIDPEYSDSKEYAKFNKKFWGGFALIRPGKLKGHQDSLILSYGVDWLNSTAQSYYLRSLNAFIGVRDFVYKEYEVKQHDIPRKDAKLAVDDKIELASISSLFYRLGLHRLPAKLPEYLFNEGDDKKEEKTIMISDLISLQEWQIKNLDALFGEFPLKIKYKDLEGKEETLRVDNIAETLAELIGLAINIATDSDTSVAIGFKNLVESTKACNAAIVAGDYARANADYLGYKGKEKARKVKLTYSPNKNNIAEALKESESNIVGFEIDDKESLQEQIGKLLIITQIIKSAFYFPWQPGEKITGDAIREKREEDKDKADKDWEEFVTELNNPSGIKKIKGNPIPKIRDINTGDK